MVETYGLLFFSATLWRNLSWPWPNIAWVISSFGKRGLTVQLKLFITITSLIFLSNTTESK